MFGKIMRQLFVLAVLLTLSACGVSVTSTYLLTDKGAVIEVSYRDKVGSSRIFFGAREVEGILAAFRLAIPLSKPSPAESGADMVFLYKVDGKIVTTYILCREGELLQDGKWFQVDKKWLYRWQSTYDPRNSRRPNQALKHNAYDYVRPFNLCPPVRRG